MKRIKYNIAGIAFGIIGLAACSEQEFTTFQGDKSGIYMANVSSYDLTGTVIKQYTDSITFSFASYKPEVKELKRNITVRVMGNSVAYDRSFVLKVDETKSTAVRGKHFDFKDEDCFIPANAVTKEMPVTVYRHDDLAEKILRIEFYIEDNENFTAELGSYKNTPNWNSTGSQLSGTHFKFAFSELYAVTDCWNQYVVNNYLGTWSASKEKRVNALMGWTHVDWENFNIALGVRMFVSTQMQRQLQALADAGTPVIDDNGQYMQLGSRFQIDYSMCPPL